MAIFAVAETTLGIPSLGAAFVAALARGEAVQLFAKTAHDGSDVEGEGVGR